MNPYIFKGAKQSGKPLKKRTHQPVASSDQPADPSLPPCPTHQEK